MVRVLGVLSVAGLLALAPDGSAGGKPKAAKGKGVELLFQKLDTNHDGKLSKDEFAKLSELRKAKGEGKVKVKGKGLDALFGKLDTNNDGFLSLDEFKKIRELQKKKKDAE
jgi:Ca2+-binding EF-hand superfamily protein